MNTSGPTFRSALNPRSMAFRFGANQFACLVIALVLWMFRVDDSFGQLVVISLMIGNACWVLIDGGRAVVAHLLYRRLADVDCRPGDAHPRSADWPGWPWMVPIVVVGTAAGYAIGHTAARHLLGIGPGNLATQGRVMVFSLVAAMIVAYLYYLRERMHAQHLQAAAAEKAASELQLKLLQSQLEPHMLFNTLANLRVLIGLDPPRAQAMLDQLIRFLRTTLASSRIEHHALSAEFDALRDYLALMAVRMGPRLTSSFDLPADLAAVPVPPLLLQPLVENAIRHGLEPQVDGGRIDVSAHRLGHRLRLTVRDTGAGLPDGPVRDGAFGLQQVRQRLAALHGDQATLTLARAPDASGGTVATIELPLTPSP